MGGLVSITASSAFVSLAVAVLIGAISSVLLIFAEQLLEKLKIDDPVGAIPVHLGCGIWGTLAAGIFANQLPPYINDPIIRFDQIMAQIIGIFAINLTILILSFVFWLIIGLAIYTTESLNDQLKSPEADKSLAEIEKYAMENPNLPQNILYKYLHFARVAIRVSSQEETKGSDGTFS